MNAKKLFLLLVAAILISATFFQNRALATDQTLSVRQGDATCGGTAATCFTTIQTALDYVNGILSANTGTSATFSLLVEPGTYTESITLGSGISSIRGTETARTILTGGGSGTLVTVSGGNPTIANLTFINAQTGVAIINNVSATIQNNIFNLGQNGTAVQATGSSALTTILNNTFYINNIVINSSLELQIKSNIFSNNTTAPAIPVLSSSLVTNNDFFENANIPAIPSQGDGAGNISVDPIFVDPTVRDFHLQAGSLCIHAGVSGVDMGAYGGTGADMIPFQVTGVQAALASAGSSTILVTWTQNLNYQVIGYRIWYGKTPGVYDGTGASEGNSPISIETGTSFILSGLSTTVITPGTPTLNHPSVQNESLVLSWSAVSGANWYRVYHDAGDQPSPPSPPPTTMIDNITGTTYTLGGLTNNVTYKVAVSAVAQATYYIAVTAVTATVTGATRDPKNESTYSSPDAQAGSGEIKESPQSNVEIEFPEALVPYPNLPNGRKGCFIATAAYGYYGAPEVQALRTFRDRYLLTNRVGRAFVRWYYEHGPVGAAYLDAHPAWKPLVRAALLPAIGASLFMTKTSLFAMILIMFCMLSIVLMTVYRFSVRRDSGSGGVS